MVGFEPMTGSHTADNLLKALIDVLDDICITEKVFTITTDNAANMLSMGRLLEQYAKQKK